MALFSGSSGGTRRPLGPRPFSGRESSAHAPALRPHGDPRRATAAPFQAIPEFTAPEASVSLATPSEVPVTEPSHVAPTSELAAAHEDTVVQPMPSLAPSVLRVHDIRSEPFGWESPVGEPDPVDDAAQIAAFDAPESMVEAVIEDVAVAAASTAPTEEVVVGSSRADAPEAVSDAMPTPAWVDVVEPEAPVANDDSERVDAYSMEEAGPGLEDMEVSALHDAASLEIVDEDLSAPEHAPIDDWFADDVMHTDSDPAASLWMSDEGSVDIPVYSPWTDLAETVDAPTLETEAIEVAGAAEPTVDAVVDEVCEHLEVVAEAPATVAPADEVVNVAPHDGFMSVEVGADAIMAVAPRDEEIQDAAPESEAAAPELAVTSDVLPDESWWSGPSETAALAMPEPPVAPVLAARHTPPVDGLAALEALVSETQGAERAVEALEAVARMIRSREIVVSVGAGASAESVLASILASLLSHPS